MSNSTISKLNEITILYEDTDVVAINKPAGIMVHPDGRSSGPFVTDWVLEHYPKTVKVGESMLTPQGEKLMRPGIVHRLDRETSGVLLIAKTKKGHAQLKQQFKDRTIKKKYLAFVWGELKEEFGTITRPIGRSGSDFRKWSASRGVRGEQRDAETYWSKVKTFINDGHRFTVVEAEPKTGRTHQIRVHFSAIQHPVVGDVLYAESRPMELGFHRTALHARSIEFDTYKGDRIKIEAPLPDDFVRAYEEAGITQG